MKDYWSLIKSVSHICLQAKSKQELIDLVADSFNLLEEIHGVQIQLLDDENEWREHVFRGHDSQKVNENSLLFLKNTDLDYWQKSKRIVEDIASNTDIKRFTVPIMQSNQLTGLITLLVHTKNKSATNLLEALEVINHSLANAIAKLDLDREFFVFRNNSIQKEESGISEKCQERFQFFTESTFEGIIVLKGEIIVDLNSSILALTGYEREDLIGANLFQFNFKEDDLGKIKQSLIDEFDAPFEVELVRKDGKAFIAEIEYKESLYYGEKVRVAAVRDVTLRKQLNSAINSSERRQRNLMSNLPGMAYTCLNNRNWDMDFLSEGCYELLGYRPNELINGKITFSDCIHPDDKERVWNIIQSKVRNKEPFELEYRIKTKNGDEKWVWERGKEIDVDGELMLEGFINDISARKLAEQKVVNSENKYKALFNGINDAAFVHPFQEKGFHKFVEVNDIACERYGYTYVEFQGMSPVDLSSNDVLEKLGSEEGRQNLAEKKWSLFETEHRTRLGKKIPVEISSRLFEIDGERIVLTLARDITKRKEAEKQLLENEYRYRAVFENTGTAICIIEANRMVSLVNNEFVKLSGYSKEEIEGVMDWTNFIHPQDVNRMLSQHSLRRSNGDKALNRYEFRFKDRFGNIRFIKLHIDLIEGTQKSVASLLDVTANKEWEKEIKTQKDVFKGYLENAPYGIFVANAKGDYVDVNFEAQNITGYSREELLKMNLMELILPADQERAANSFGKLVHNGEPVDVEIRFITKRGEVKYWHVNASDSGSGLYIGYTVDVTIRKNNEAKMMQLLHDQNILLDNDPTFIIFKDTSNNILRITNSVSKMTCLPKDQIEGRHSSEVYPGMADEYYKDDLEVIKTGKPKMGIIEPLFDAKGNKKWLLTNKIPYIENNGGVSGIILFSTDITEMVQKEEQLKEAKRKAEESDKLKTAFLANMSHEIRTPMNGILGFTNLLKDPELSGEEKEQFIDIIQKSGDRMLNTINDIIDISKIESGNMEVVYSRVNPYSLIIEIVEFFKPEAIDNGIELKLKVAKEGVGVVLNSDADKVHAILTNLIKNALKFTPDGEIIIGFDILDQEIQFFVKDTGIGIPNDRIDAIFDRFTQADLINKNAVEGSGLGLSISRSFAEMLKGRLWAESEVGVGTVFKLLLPMHSETGNNITEQFKPAGIIPELKISRKVNVLLAEDDEVSAEYMKILMKPFSKEIKHVRNGVDAVRAMEADSNIDLILMDIKMPEMDGLKATRKIREFNKDVVIISQTAFAQTEDKTKAIGSGCNGYITKPVRKKELFRMLHKYFGS